MDLIAVECIKEHLTFCEAILAFVGVMVVWRNGGKVSRGTRDWELYLLCLVGVCVIPLLGYFIIAGC
jgi:hypothetical protein